MIAPWEYVCAAVLTLFAIAGGVLAAAGAALAVHDIVVALASAY